MKGWIIIEDKSYGFLNISVRTARDALPVPGAYVVITTDYKKAGVLDTPDEIVYTAYTDISGATPKIRLEAPSVEGSSGPGRSNPCYYYNIRTSKEGFYTIENVSVEIYAGITTLQTIRMIPRLADSRVAPDETM